MANLLAHIRHGRDNKLIVWHLGPSNESDLNTILPIDAPTSPKAPWILHLLTVNTLNFCSFALCVDGMQQAHQSQTAIRNDEALKPVLIAVPNTVDSNGVRLLPLRRWAMTDYLPDRHLPITVRDSRCSHNLGQEPHNR